MAKLQKKPSQTTAFFTSYSNNRKKTSYTQLYEDQMEEQMANGKCTCVDALLNSATKGKNLKPPIKKSGIFASKSQKYETLLHHIDS